MRLRALAPAKVNLCLFLGPARADGRHELVTLMEPVSLADELELETLGAGRDEVYCRGISGPNLASAALAALRGRGWDAPPVSISIQKRIPVAAGLGGGSADAAATLRLAAELAPVPGGTLGELAASLGSDVPGQLAPGVVLATGAGEVIELLPALAPHAFAILPQPFGLSTAEVYARADRMGLQRAMGDLAGCRRDLTDALAGQAALPDTMLVNDLLPAARSLAPEIQGALDAIAAAGADHSTLCGSGPTVAGLFWGAEARRRASSAVALLAGDHPGAVAAWPVSKLEEGLRDGGPPVPHLQGGAQSAGLG